MAFVLGPPPDPKTGFESQSWQTWFYQLWQALKNATRSFGGATSSTAGSPGLVPAPAAGQTHNVLRGDGTWGWRIEVMQTTTDSSGHWTVNYPGTTFTVNPNVHATAPSSGATAATQNFASVTIIGTNAANGYVQQGGVFVGAGINVLVTAIGF